RPVQRTQLRMRKAELHPHSVWEARPPQMLAQPMEDPVAQANGGSTPQSGGPAVASARATNGGSAVAQANGGNSPDRFEPGGPASANASVTAMLGGTANATATAMGGGAPAGLVLGDGFANSFATTINGN